MNNRLAAICICFLLLLQSCPALAAEPITDDVTDVFRVLWALLIVLAIILGLYGLLRNRLSLTNPRRGKSIRVLEIQPLMPKKSLCLVEVKGKEYLLGIGNDDITFLASLDNSSKGSFQETLENTRYEQQQ